MTNLNLTELSPQIASLAAERHREGSRRRKALLAARNLLRAQSGRWHEHPQDHVRVPWIVPRPLGDPSAAVASRPRPTPLTAVAVDGSQIFPDPHFEPTVFLLNISEIAFQYGTLEEPTMTTRTHLGPRSRELGHRALVGARHTGADVISALRDQKELETLFSLATQCRKLGRPIVALADGTLIRWMLNRIEPGLLKQQFIVQYAAQLANFRRERIPVCSVISMPNSNEVVNLLRALRGETDDSLDDSLAGILDRRLYDPFLADGDRTSVFASDSGVLGSYDAPDRVCFFYVRVQGRHKVSEIARVELPFWVASEPALLNLVHATVVSECTKGEGYPMILAEAHAHAVIKMRDRELFYSLVEREMSKMGLPHSKSRKHASKRRPVV